MHQTYLPITAFLIADAAQEHLSYWKSFVAAGGMIGDHTVSHPYLTRLTLGHATAQWGRPRTALGRWLRQTPVVGARRTGPSTARQRWRQPAPG
jgi:peptidoglycan/xylan/chitin deacetylase (PgdA/CDA1 family)